MAPLARSSSGCGYAPMRPHNGNDRRRNRARLAGHDAPSCARCMSQAGGNMRTAVDIACAAVFAMCVIAGPAHAVTGGGGGGGYESEQGQDIFGTRDAGLEGAKIPVVPTSPAAYQRLRIDAGQLHAQKGGADVAGAGVVGLDLVATRVVGADLGKAVTVHIAAARPHVNIYTHVASD